MAETVKLEDKEDWSNHFCARQVMKRYKALHVVIAKRKKKWLLKVTYICISFKNISICKNIITFLILNLVHVHLDTYSSFPYIASYNCETLLATL